MKALDLTGQRFCRLTVVERTANVASGKRSKVAWLCDCDCGAVHVASTTDLRAGTVRSCGCLGKEIRLRAKTTHGMSYSAEYRTWDGMKRRCLNRQDPRFKHYGARGITLCDRWRDFAAFYEDMGPRPTPQHSIERRNNDAGYSPDNCYWATKIEQGSNTRNTKWMTLNGVTKCQKQWARDCGLDLGTVRYRLSKGWTTEAALTTPAGPSGPKGSRTTRHGTPG